MPAPGVMQNLSLSLKPDPPSHSSPAPFSISRLLLGENISLSLFNLGPT